MDSTLFTDLLFWGFSVMNLVLMINPRAILRFFGTERYFTAETVEHPSFYLFWRLFGGAWTAVALWSLSYRFQW